jgi:8-oxo-dGTP pyrophosphatase MutT (NUDIX family)
MGGFFAFMDSSAVHRFVSGLNDASDGELVKSRELALLILEHTPAPFSRSQFTPGHITCTGLVSAPDGGDILLVHHRRLDRWLLPGGHVDAADVEIWDAARREVIEETGVALVDDTRPTLVGIDVHGIPPGRGEPYHLHHDLLFAFRARSREFCCSEESRAVAWCGRPEFGRYDLPRNIVRAVGRVGAL